MMQTLANAIALGRSTVLLFAVATSVLASAPMAGAEEAYPSRPIRLIVPFRRSDRCRGTADQPGAFE
jgi:hypothetical protein